MRLLQSRSPKLGLIGGWLALLGTVVAIGDGSTQFVTWLMVRPGQDPTQMARLLDALSKSAGANITYTIGGPALLVGVLLLSIGMYRSRVAPWWVPVTFFAAVVVNIVAFSNAMSVGVTASYLILLAPMAHLARVVVRDERVTVPTFVTPRPSPAVAEA
jgi:hypothetical protein